MNPPPRRDMHPLAINILKLQRYNFDFFSCEQVVLFEYMMVKGMSFKKLEWFYHSSETIRSETGIGRYALDTILKQFERLGILQVELKGMPRVKHFRIDFKRVIELLPHIYRTPDDRLPAELVEQLKSFFVPLAKEQAARRASPQAA